MPTHKKLVLFDIDGTLLRHFGGEPDVNVGWYRFIHALNSIFHIHAVPTPEVNYHGSVDRAILYDIARKYGVAKSDFDAKWEAVKAAVIEYAHTKETKRIYEAIPEAVQLLKRIHERPDLYYLGILTGNVEKMAYWKLRHIGIDPRIFRLFVTSDEFEDRISLAKSTFMRVEKDMEIVVLPQQTIVIGDAIGDIQCAKAIGAKSIIVTTGRHKQEELEKERPTLLVDSLMDGQVFDVLGLSQ